MTTLNDRSENARKQIAVMKTISYGLSQAMGACSQLANQLDCPKYILTKRMLEIMHEYIMLNAQFKTKIETPKVQVH